MVKFFVNSEVFENLLLPGRPGANLTFDGIRRFQSVLLRGNLNQITEDYFVKLCSEHCDLYQENSQAIFILTHRYFYRNEGQEEININLLLFSLFVQLFQVYTKRLTRSRSVDRLSTEHWPGKPGLDEQRKHHKTYDEDLHVHFYQERIKDLWEILCLKDDLKDRNRVWDTAFTVLEKDEKISFQEVLKTIPPEEIISIIQKNLKTTREGVLACIKTYGKRISWPLGEIMPPKKIEKPKMATNAHVLMPRKIIVINKLLYKTVARRSSTLVGGHVKIHRCNNSFLYLLSPLMSLTITKCVNTTIVTGPVHEILRVQGCSGLNIISLASLVLVGETWDSSLYLRTEKRPIIDRRTSGNLGLYPYNVNYVGLDSDLKSWRGKSRLDFYPNPLLINPEGTNSVLVPQNSTQFSQFFIPFLNLNIKSLTELPDEFRCELEKREEPVNAWKLFLESQGLSSEETDLVDSEVDDEFKKWLQTNNAEIKGLESLANNMKIQNSQS